MTTLGRQLFLGASLIFLVSLSGIGAIYVANARFYLQEQLDSHAQDAATSLGLSLTARSWKEDPAYAQTVINAAFDRGHYERIVLTDVEGRTLVEKRLPREEADVPSWFVRLLPLSAPTASSLVTQGWRQLGRVSVTSHPRFAYAQLWRTGLETASWLAFIYVLALVAMRLFLSGLLRPLAQIEATAQAIAQRNYRTIDLVPRARELYLVVKAMNALSGKVREAIESETARAGQLHREAFLDPVTGIANRRGVVQQFDARIAEDNDVFSATLLLVQIDDFAGYNRAHGYVKGDEALRIVAGAVADFAAARGALAGRWAGASFVVVVPGVGAAEAPALADDLCGHIEARLTENGLGGTLRFNAGAASFDRGKPSLSTLLAAADGAVAQAQARGPNLAQTVAVDAGEAAGTGSMDWRERITRALAEGRLALYRHPAFSLPGREALHLEITTRLVAEDGSLVPAASFLPMAARHGLVQELDRDMLERVFARLHPDRVAGALLAVNVSPASAADPAFVSWLSGRLQAHRDVAKRLVFELAEAGVMRDVEAAAAFAASVRRCGAGFAVDGFGAHRESLQMLKRLLPDYVKLAASHTATVRDDAASRFFVESVVRIARSLDVSVIAQAVESEELMPLLEGLGIAGYQGYVSGRPEPLE